jgi:hypothetical protein
MADRKLGKHGYGGNGPEGAWEGAGGRKKEPEAAALDRILGDMEFPASKEDVARQLAVEAFTHGGGRAADLHDLIIQLDDQAFRDLAALHRAVRERHSWEKTHDMLA